jgi:hypothetical protein
MTYLVYESYYVLYMIIHMRPNVIFYKWLILDALVLTWLQLLLGVCTAQM